MTNRNDEDSFKSQNFDSLLLRLSSNQLLDKNRDVVYWYAIEGLCGAGKSTLLKKAAIDFMNNEHFYIIIIMEDEASYNLYKNFAPLDLIYKDPGNNGLAVELHIVECMNKKIQQAIQDIQRSDIEKPIILVSDRGVFSPLIFANLLSKSSHLSDFSYAFLTDQIYEKAENTIRQCNLQPIGLFYLDTKIDVCLERIKNRGKYYEQAHDEQRRGAGITRNFLLEMQNEYEKHLMIWEKNFAGHSNSEFIVLARACDPTYLFRCLMKAYNATSREKSSSDALSS